MSRFKPLASILTSAPALLICFAALALAQDRPYALRVSVTSGRSSSGLQGSGGGTPLRGSTVRLIGSGIAAAEYPEVGAVAQLTGPGVKINERGEMTVYLRRGTYKAEFSDPAHHPFSMWITVPPPGMESTSEFDLCVELAMKESVTARTLTVAVESDGAAAVPGARVEIHSEGIYRGQTSTGSNGIATIDLTFEDVERYKHLPREQRPITSFVPGDYVRVAVTADGYAPQETTFVVGSRQDTGANPLVTNRTTTSDFVRVVLRKSSTPTVQSATLIVEAVRGDNGAPIPGAKVDLMLTNGNWAWPGKTDAKGRTDPLELAPLAPGRVDKYQARVSAPGFSEKWSDVPFELIKPGEPTVYVVHLDPVASYDPRANWTVAEKAGFDRVVAWARQRPPIRFREYGQQVEVAKDYVNFDWKDMKSGADGPPWYGGSVTVGYKEHKPGDPMPGPVEVPDGHERIMIGPYAGERDRKNYRLLHWRQGWFTVSLYYHSQWLIRPTDPELMALANELAGVLGDQGR